MSKTTQQLEDIFEEVVSSFEKSDKSRKALDEILLQASKKHSLNAGEAGQMEIRAGIKLPTR